MADIQSSEFEQFFFELHNKPPFPWQTRLAHQVCEQGWPKVIDLPTASGKTACIDIVLFALAARGNLAPRRIFLRRRPPRHRQRGARNVPDALRTLSPRLKAKW